MAYSRLVNTSISEYLASEEQWNGATRSPETVETREMGGKVM